MIRLVALFFLGFSSIASAECAPDGMIDHLQVSSLNRAFEARIDRSRIALSGEEYCAVRPSHRRSLELPVQLQETEVPVSITPLASMIFPCRTLSRGMVLAAQSEEGLLYTDDALNAHSLGCFSYKGSLTMSCYAQARSCRLWNIRALDPDCPVWIFSSVPKALAKDWRAVVDQIDAAINLSPACNRRT